MSQPAEEQMEAWVKEHHGVHLFTHQGQLYIFRQLTRREYRAALKVENPIEMEDEIIRTTVLWPKEEELDFDNTVAGLFSSICSEIVRVSGCGPGMREKFIADMDKVSESMDMQMEAVVAHVFGLGGSDFSIYQDWSYQSLMDAYYRAQWILQNVQQVAVGVQAQGPPQANPRDRKRRAEMPTSAPAQATFGPGDVGEALGKLDAFGGGKAALTPMSEFVERNQKFERHRARTAALKAANLA